MGRMSAYQRGCALQDELCSWSADAPTWTYKASKSAMNTWHPCLCFVSGLWLKIQKQIIVFNFFSWVTLNFWKSETSQDRQPPANIHTSALDPKCLKDEQPTRALYSNLWLLCRTRSGMMMMGPCWLRPSFGQDGFPLIFHLELKSMKSTQKNRIWRGGAQFGFIYLLFLPNMAALTKSLFAFYHYLCL